MRRASQQEAVWRLTASLFSYDYDLDPPTSLLGRKTTDVLLEAGVPTSSGKLPMGRDGATADYAPSSERSLGLLVATLRAKAVQVWMYYLEQGFFP